MSLSVSLLLAVVAVVIGVAVARPSDGWTPSQNRAFGSSLRRSYSVHVPVNNRVSVSARAATPSPVADDEDAEAVVSDGPEGRSADNEVADEDSWFSWLVPSAEMRVVGKVWEDCTAKEDTTTCLKGKALTFLDRAAKKESLNLPGGLSLVRTAKDAAADRAPVSEAELESVLPRDLSARDAKLDSMLLDRVLGFVQTHAIRFNLGEQTGEERGIKKKDIVPYLLLGKLVASSMVAMAFTGLALLAGKALMVSKVALLLSGIVALKKLFGGQGHSSGQVEVVNVPSHGRSLDNDDDDTSALAYRGQIQRPATARATTRRS